LKKTRFSADGENERREPKARADQAIEPKMLFFQL
jgi:hypothetical protein